MKDNYEYFKYEFLDKTYYIMVNQSAGVVLRLVNLAMTYDLRLGSNFKYIEDDLLYSCTVCVDSTGKVLKCREDIRNVFDSYYGIEK